MIQREYYEGVVDLAPSGLFGNASFDGISITSSADGFRSYEIVNALLYGEESPFPKVKDPIEVELSINDESYSLISNQLTIRIIESFPGGARSKIESKAHQIVRRLSFIIGKSVTYDIRNISRVSGEINPTEYKCIPYTVYDRMEMTRAFTRALTEFDDDALLEQSMDYLRLGELFLNIWGKSHSDEHFRNDMNWKLGNAVIGAAFLNFWKSITIITEELGSTESEIRLKALGLDSKKFRKILQSLKSLRNSFDIAHRNYDSSSIYEPRHFINVIKTVAQSVIESYIHYSKRTGKTFDISQERDKKRYKNQISFLREVFEDVPKSKLDFGWAISRSETTNR